MHRSLPVLAGLLLTGLLCVLSSASAASDPGGDLPRVGNRPLEALPGLDTEYGVLDAGGGARLRTLVTRPRGATGRLPAGLFVQWLSCDTVELGANPQGGWSTMLARLLSESDMLWMRTEKSGVGDSQGPACTKLDYETELAHHRAALRALRARPDVDPKRIVIYGASMGSNYAPLLAADEDLAGVVVWGGGAATWFERMLRFERNALELGGTDAQTLAAEMNARAAFFARYLLGGESPTSIAAADAALGRVWPRIVGTSADGHYGRPFAFHQQAQRQNWAGAWARVKAPVLALYGEYDWFESRDSVQLIATLVERQRPGTAQFRELAQLDHHFTRYPSARDAFGEKNGSADAGPAVEAILEWLSRIGVRRASATGEPSATLESYQRARGVLDAGVRALGGAQALAQLRSVRREFFDTWFDPSQGARPWQGNGTALPPANTGFERTAVVSEIDYAGRRYLETQKYVDSPDEYAWILDAVTPERGFRSITYIEEKPFYETFAGHELSAMTTRKLRRHPEGLLRMALARPESLQWVGAARSAGREQHVVSFADATGTRVSLYFDAETALLARAETLRDHPVAGDTSSETAFSDYRAVGSLRLPFRYLDRSAGVPTRDQQMAVIEPDAALDDSRFAPPREFVAVQPAPESPQLVPISTTLYLIRGAYNVLFSVFPDGVVLYEAPMNDAYAQQILQLVREAAPGKPIRYAVASHFHADHLGAARSFVAEGITLLTTPDAHDVVRQALTRPHTLYPDTLSRRPAAAPQIETVTRQRVLDAGGVRARLYDFGPAPHVTQILGAYFPDEKLLYVADLMDVVSDELVIAGVDAVPLREKVRQLGLDVQRFVPVHGTPISGEQFERAFRVREKYLR